MKSDISYPDLEAFCAAHPELKKQFIAARLRMTPVRFSKIKARRIGATDAEIRAIADLLNQSVPHARSLYERAA
jgi:hypothetical protein